LHFVSGSDNTSGSPVTQPNAEQLSAPPSAGYYPVVSSGDSQPGSFQQIPGALMVCGPPAVGGPFGAPSGTVVITTQPQVGSMPQQNIILVQGGPGDMRVQKINDLLGLSIFTTICCCLIFGIIAIVYSMRVREAKAKNNYLAAKAAYKVTLAMNLTGLLVATVMTAISIVFSFVAG
jgi:hypothetical protein